jgi:hypothetical protein
MCRNPDGFLHKHIRFRFFCARFRRTTYACTPCATKSNAPNDFISPQAGSAKKAQTEKALGEAKKAQTEKADKSVFWAFIQHKYKESR